MNLCSCKSTRSYTCTKCGGYLDESWRDELEAEIKTAREDLAAITECHEADSKYITKLRSEIARKDEALRKIYENVRSVIGPALWAYQIAKEALSRNGEEKL